MIGLRWYSWVNLGFKLRFFDVKVYFYGFGVVFVNWNCWVEKVMC